MCFLPRQAAARGVTALDVSIVAFAVWIVVTNLWANPSYTAAAPYHAGFLLGGYLLGRRAGGENAGLLLAVGLAFTASLAVWALWQRVGQGAPRAQALFEAPATLASTINLVLLPGLVLLASRKRNVFLIATLVALVAALAATASRGGWFGLAAGTVVALLLLRRAAITLDRKSAATAGAVLAAGCLVSFLAPPIWEWVLAEGVLGIYAPGAGQPPHSMIGTAADSAASRLGLYQTAAQAFPVSRWLLGSGYLAFHYLVDAAQPPIPSYTGTTTYFVHNDYLQTLLELGLPGLAALLLIAALPIMHAWRALPHAAPDARLKIIALAGGIASMAAHALVDFPFYIPVCLLIYGTAAALLESLISTQQSIPAGSAASTRLRRAALAGAATVALWVVAKPVAAQAAAAYAQHEWRASQAQSAAYWFEIARRLEPRDWRYHWYVGQFWFAQAQTSRNPIAARYTDESFAAGFATNPREVPNLLGRIATHRQLRGLLAAPADPATLRGWADAALKLAPRDPAVRAEAALVIGQFGARTPESSK